MLLTALTVLAGSALWLALGVLADRTVLAGRQRGSYARLLMYRALVGGPLAALMMLAESRRVRRAAGRLAGR